MQTMYAETIVEQSPNIVPTGDPEVMRNEAIHERSIGDLGAIQCAFERSCVLQQRYRVGFEAFGSAILRDQLPLL